MKEEKVARPDVLSYEQGRQDERAEIQAGVVSVAGLIEKARAEERVKIREEIEKERVKLKSVPKRIYDYQKDTIRDKSNYIAGFGDGVQAQLNKVLKALES